MRVSTNDKSVIHHTGGRCMERIDNPKVFISYAWSSKEYEMKVLAFATSLKGDGVDVVLDKWAVSGGNDMNSFMEKSVNDPTVTNVLILLDETYAIKANSRQGGVGTETQIISQEVYKSVEQTKFIPVVFERNATGDVCKPTYLQGRYHFDLTNPETYSEEYQSLVRSLYGVENYRVPELGTRPAWVDMQIEVPAKVITEYDSLKDNLPDFIKQERFQTFLDELAIQITSLSDVSFKDSQSLDEYLEHYDDTKGIKDRFLTLVARSRYVNNSVEMIGTALEKTINKLNEDSSLGSEIGKVLVHELFISILAVFLRRESYKEAGYLLGRTYFHSRGYHGTNLDDSYFIFYSGSLHTQLDDAIKKRDGKQYHSGTAKCWIERIDEINVLKEDFIFADLICFNYAVYGNEYLSDFKWFPVTYIYQNQYNSCILSLGKKLISREQISKILPLFNFSDLDSFIQHFTEKEQEILKGLHRDYRYSSAYESAPLLGYSIKSEELGKVR